MGTEYCDLHEGFCLKNILAAKSIYRQENRHDVEEMRRNDRATLLVAAISCTNRTQCLDMLSIQLEQVNCRTPSGLTLLPVYAVQAAP